MKNINWPVVKTFNLFFMEQIPNAVASKTPTTVHHCLYRFILCYTPILGYLEPNELFSILYCKFDSSISLACLIYCILFQLDIFDFMTN